MMNRPFGTHRLMTSHLQVFSMRASNVLMSVSQSSMACLSLPIGTLFGCRVLLIRCLLACGLSGSNFAVNLRHASSPKDLLLFLTIASANLTR